MKIMSKPEWLLKKINLKEHSELKKILSSFSLHTICEEALCPNISECFKNKQASFLILGNKCTRECSFCNVDKSKPEPYDEDEPLRLAKVIFELGLKHVVVTSPTRDDLEDGGARGFCESIEAIRNGARGTRVEVLIPDFKGNKDSIRMVVKARPDIIGHNLETVQRLYSIRKGADYTRSLELLKYIKEIDHELKTKSGIMLGLGETVEEVESLFQDLLSVDCRYLSIGQYLAPKKSNYPVKEFVVPEVFDRLKSKALKMGFSHVESAPFVRSSYLADKYIKEN